MADQFGDAVENPTITWSVTKATGAGDNDVAVSAAGVVTVSKTAVAGAYTITAACGEKTGTYTLTVTRTAAAAATLTIGGVASLTASGSGTVTSMFTATVTDQFGATMSGQDVTWSVVGSTGVSIASGTLTVPTNATAGPATITAKVGDVTATKDVTISAAPALKEQHVVFADVTDGKVSATYGDAPITHAATVTETTGGEIGSYKSGNEAVATVTSGGVVTIVGVGETTITATAGATADYALTTASYKLTVAKKTLTSADFTVSDNTKAYTGSALTAKVTAPEGVSITTTYLQNGEKVASPTNAGTYTIKVSCAATAKYNAATDLDLGTLTITKADFSYADENLKVFEGTNVKNVWKACTGSIFTLGKFMGIQDYDTTISLLEAGSISFASSDENVLHVDGMGFLYPKANGIVTITVTLADANHNSKTLTMKNVKSIGESPLGDVKVSTTTIDKDSYSWNWHDETVELKGAITDGATVTITPTLNDGFTLADSKPISFVAKAGSLTATAATFTINGADGFAVTYNVDASGVKILPANATFDTPENKINNTISDQTNKGKMESVLERATVSALNIGAAAQLADAASTAISAKTSDLQTAFGSNEYNVAIQTTVALTAKSYDETSGSAKMELEITPQYTIKANGKSASDGKDATVELATGTISTVDYPVSIEVPLPESFPTVGLVAKHTHNGTTEYLPVTVNNGVASWEMKSFSTVELMQDNRTATLHFDSNVGDKTFTIADIGKPFPTASETGKTFTGWKIFGTLFTTLNKSLWDAMVGGTYNAVAQFTTNSPSNPGSSSSSGATTPATVKPATGAVAVNTTVSGATANITASDAQLATAAATAKANGTVNVDISNLNVSSASIPAKLLTAVTTGSGTASLSVTLPTGTVTLDAAALVSIGAKDATISVEPVKGTALSAAQQAVLGTQAANAVVVSVDVLVANAKLTTFNGGKLTIAVPYTLKSGENADNITVWYLADDGTITPMAGRYNASTKTVDFNTTHLSTYAVVAFPFADVPETFWAYSGIAYAYTHNLFAGTTATTFAPNVTMNRQMIWMVLARMDGKTPANMTEAKAWAIDNKISDGSNPTAPITREQLAAILYRYAQYKGYDTTQGGMALKEFADYGKISSYAISALTWAVNAKLIQGSGNSVNPKGGATRAQVATILTRFCQTLVK